MKLLFPIAVLGISGQILAGEIDYSYCQEAFNLPEVMQGARKNYPFKLEKDGKLSVHKDANYSFDKESGSVNFLV